MNHSHARRLAARIGRIAAATMLTAALPTLLFGQDVKLGRPDSSAKARAESKPAPGSIEDAAQLAYKARDKYRTVRDYACIFIKQERVNGELLPREFVEMKARARPFSVYLKWQKPYEGREAIYVEGQNDGKVMVHSTGAEKVIAGTLALDPRGDRAMENSRHDITEAGLGKLIDKLITGLETERKLGKTQIEIKDNAKVDTRICTLVKTTHPNDPKRYEYYRTKIFFDKELGLPIRFEGYSWPKKGSAPDGDLVEEYTYRDLRVNISVTAMDFSTDNPKYNFGRL